eukprot:3940002-Rhodomonas_salina.2
MAELPPEMAPLAPLIAAKRGLTLPSVSSRVAISAADIAPARPHRISDTTSQTRHLSHCISDTTSQPLHLSHYIARAAPRARVQHVRECSTCASTPVSVRGSLGSGSTECVCTDPGAGRRWNRPPTPGGPGRGRARVSTQPRQCRLRS